MPSVDTMLRESLNLKIAEQRANGMQNNRSGAHANFGEWIPALFRSNAFRTIHPLEHDPENGYRFSERIMLK